MTKARNLSDLLDATGDVVSTALDNVPPSDNASSLTTGTLPIARLADGSITSAKLGNDAKVVKSATAPANPSEGDLWYDTGNEVLKVYQQTFGNFIKVSAEQATLTSITGTIYNSLASNLTLNGTGFLDDNLIVSFTPSGGSTSTVNVTPANDTTATVAVPSAIYNQSANTVISIYVTNSDGSTSSSINKTIIALPSGGTITNSGGYRIHTFTSSSTFINTLALTNIEYLIIAGGGGGASGYQAGGGGAGGYRSSVSGESSGGGASAESPISSLSAGSYTVTVGAGGAGTSGFTSLTNTLTPNGNNSEFNSIVSLGGGGGASYWNNNSRGRDGGSGGGGGNKDPDSPDTGGSGTSGQGYAGGNAIGYSSPWSGGGGGGASQVGTNGGGSGAVGHGGNGVASSITGSSVTRAGGGGAGCYENSLASGGTGGGGDGGRGSNPVTASQAGTVNTGGGGGAGGGNGQAGSSGGSGIVILRYQL